MSQVRPWAITIALLALASASLGQSVPKAKVSLTNEATGAENLTFTNESGYYVVPNLPPGSYTVRAEAAGFKRFESAHNKLDPNSTLPVDASLTVGAATETVEVAALATPLQTESAVVQKLVTRSQIDALELNGRNPIYMASLQPGIRSGSTLGDFNFSVTNGGYYINGARTEDSLITFDGAPATRTRANDSSIGVADHSAARRRLPPRSTRARGAHPRSVASCPGRGGSGPASARALAGGGARTGTCTEYTGDADPHGRLLSGIWTRRGRTDPHHHQERWQGVPRERLRILPEF